MVGRNNAMHAGERGRHELLTNPDSVRLTSWVRSSAVIRFVSFGLVLLTVLAAGAVAYFTERGIVSGRDWVIHSYQVRSQLGDLQIEIMRARNGEVTSILARDPAELPLSLEQAHLASVTVDELRRLTHDNPQQQQRLNQLGLLLNQGVSLIESQQDSTRLPVTMSADSRKRQQEIDDRESQVNSIVASLETEEEGLLEQRLRAWNHLFRRNVLMLAVAFTIMSLMLVYQFRLLVDEVTLTKNKEKRVRDNAESYRLMSAKILELQDSERRRIARELHDSVGQFLAGLKINLVQLENGARADHPHIDRPKMIRETIELTDCAIQEVRTISHLLHPPLMEELGFLSAARWYVDEYGKRSQIKVSISVDEPIRRLPREIEIALFRVLQEALTNVYRHAAAQSVDVRIQCLDGQVTLIVADDGKGIPEEILARFRGGAAPGIGLAGMRERLAEFHGEITVESSPAGSVVQATIPTNACSVMHAAK
jgi:signal transduction histidine kinase